MFAAHKELLAQLQQAQRARDEAKARFVEREEDFLDARDAMVQAQEAEAERRRLSEQAAAQARAKHAALELQQQADKEARARGAALQKEVAALSQQIPQLWREVLVLTVELERLRRLQVQFFKNKVNDTQYLFKLLKFLETAIESTVMSVLTIAVLFIELDLGAMTSWTQLKPTDNTLLFATSLGLSIMSTACTPQPALAPSQQSPVEMCGLL